MKNKKIGLAETFDIDVTEVKCDIEELFCCEADWDNFFDSNNWSECTNLGNAYLRSSKFHDKYESLLSYAGKHMGLEDFYYQAEPTFRINLPGMKSVSFHRDDLSSGHGKNIINFWIPLTKLNTQNCLWVIDETNSKKIIEEFITNKQSLSKLDREASLIAKPMVLQQGKGLCFSNRILHGAVKNDSSSVRLSLDFRCLPIGEDPGTRILGKEYIQRSERLNLLNRECISVIFQSNKMSHVGHSAQRGVISDFASRHGFTIITETSEWHGVEHYPRLIDILEEDQDMPILIFSERSFNVDSDGWSNLYNKMRLHKAPIYFCLENKQVNP